MLKIVFIVFLAVAVCGICVAGCQRKQEVYSNNGGPAAVPQEDIVVMPPQESAPDALTKSSMLTNTQQPTQPPAASGIKESPSKTSARLAGESDDIKIQRALIAAGFYKGMVDGKIGPMTRQAISAFQKAKGLKADGKVGPQTWSALKKYLQ